MKHRRSIFLLLIITVVTLYCRVEFCYAAESSDITTRASTTATTAKTAGTAAELKALLTSSTASSSSPSAIASAIFAKISSCVMFVPPDV